MASDCQSVGNTNSDIAGLGIVIPFAFQAGLSLILSTWSLLLWKPAIASLWNAAPTHRPPSKLRRALSTLHHRHKNRWDLQKRIIDAILLTISDTQTINGVGLVIAGIIQYKTLSLYHMHILYDTINFTAISNCASLVNIYGQNKESKRWTRFSLLGIFIATYLSYSVLFGIRLQGWSNALSGHCYDTHLITAPGDSHPYVDTIYLGITCFYCLAALVACIICHGLLSRMETPVEKEPFFVWRYGREVTLFGEPINLFWNFVLPRTTEEIAPYIVILAMMQYPLHLYMVITLRAANESRLSGDSENAWGFGQIVALVAAFSTLFECLRGISDYHHQVAEVKKETNATAVVGRDEEHIREPTS